MWIVESNGHEQELIRVCDSANHGCKLGPIIPRSCTTINAGCTPWTSPSCSTLLSTPSPNCSCILNTNDHLLAWNPNHVNGIDQLDHKREIMKKELFISARWNPTPEQLQALEEMYRRGLRTPTADQIQQIAGKLRRFGKIEGKNVFYWFQNHKARERQKRRRQLMITASCHEKKLRDDAQKKNKGLSKRSLGVEQTGKWATLASYNTISEDSASIQHRAAAVIAESETTDGLQQTTLSVASKLTTHHHQIDLSNSSSNLSYNPLLITTPISSPPTPLNHKGISFSPKNFHNNNNNDNFFPNPNETQESLTLQLFPLKSGHQISNMSISDAIATTKNCIDHEELTTSLKLNFKVDQFFEFLPLKG